MSDTLIALIFLHAIPIIGFVAATLNKRKLTSMYQYQEWESMREIQGRSIAWILLLVAVDVFLIVKV